MSKIEFSTKLIKVPGIDATFIRIPFDTEKEFGHKIRIKVKAWIDGQLYRGSIMNMGDGNMLGVTQEIRKKIGKNPGDSVRVIIEEDKEERTVEIPHDLAEVFRKNPEAAGYFNTLSYTNRKEYVRWVTEAKKSETRNTRLEKTVEMLLQKKKNPF